MHCIQVTVDGITYPSMTEAAAELDCTRTELSHVYKLCGNKATVFGKDVLFKKTDVNPALITRSRPVRCVETGEVYSSINGAARKIGCNPQSLWFSLQWNTCCKGRHWEYAERSRNESDDGTR